MLIRRDRFIATPVPVAELRFGGQSFFSAKTLQE